MNEPLLYFGQVFHARTRPKRKFRMRHFYLETPLKKRPYGKFPLGIDRKALFSVLARDHAGDPGASLLDNARNLAKHFRLPLEKIDISLVTIPALFGYVFNPVSFFIGRTKTGAASKIAWVLAEVHNFAGGRTLYPLVPERIQNNYVSFAEKDFYVSPFFDTTGRYTFIFRLPPEDRRPSIVINYIGEQGKLLLHTRFSGVAHRATGFRLFLLFLTRPLPVFIIPPATYYHAARLALKKIRYRKPAPEDMRHRY